MPAADGRAPDRAGACPRWSAVVAAVAILVLTTGTAAGARGAVSSPGTTAGPLERLATSLGSAPESVRADFAAVVLGEIITAYELEFERLSVPGQVSRRELAKQARWASALQSFLDELYAARDALDSGAPVEVLVAPPEPVQLLVGDRLVPVTSPRIEDPQALDREIVHVYCEGFPCDPEILDPPPPPAPVAVAGGWNFSAGMGSTYETVDGLGFMFTDVQRRGAKEHACRQVREELTRLAGALSAERRAGRTVDFDVLRLESSGEGDDQRVVIARSGARLRLSLPALARAPGVVAVARDWLRARVMGRAHRQLFPRADLLLAGLLDRR